MVRLVFVVSYFTQNEWKVTNPLSLGCNFEHNKMFDVIVIGGRDEHSR